MIDVQSIIVYLGLAFLSFVIAKYAELTNSRKAVWLIVILMSAVAGLRAVSVGIDTKTYDVVFDIISNGTVKSMYGIEASFIYFCSLLLHLWDNNHFLFFTFAFIVHGLVLFRIWQDREFISFRWSVFSYYIMFFPFSLNGIRQFVAVAIVFYATSFIKKGKYIKFSAFVVLAMMFHTSAIIGAIYLFFEIFFVKYFNGNRKLKVYLLTIFGSVLSCYLIYYLLNFYSGYFEERVSSFGLMMFVKFFLLLLSIGIIKRPQEREKRYVLYSYRWNYFVGLLLNSLSYLFLYMGRIGLYFYVFESIYIGYLFKSKNKTIYVVLLKVLYIMILLYYLYNNITKGPQGEVPYRFLWQS